MRPKKSIQELLEQSEDQLFQQIVDEQEGLLGIEESKRLGSPSEEELAQWTARLNKLAAKAAPHRRRKRLVVVVAIIAALLAVSVLAYQVDLLNFVETVQEQFTQLSPSDPPENTVSAWVGAYCPEYVPDGYMMSDAVDNGDTKAIEYTSTEGVRFMFYQSGGDTNIRIDTEAAELSDCRIGDVTGRLVRKDGLSTLFWSTTGASFSIEYDASRTSDQEIQQLAESVTKIDS